MSCQTPNGRLFYAGACCGMQGLRKTMEDAHVVNLNVGGLDHHFLMVCDGHGGDFVAKKVGELMVPHILERKSIDIHGTDQERRKSYASTLMNSFLELDKKLLEIDLIKNHEDFSGSTVCCCFVNDNEIVCANAGDTRCVVSSNLRAKDLSTDHKPSTPSEKERIVSCGGTVARGRVNGLHGVARSLGDFSYKDDGKAPPSKQHVTCVPELVVYPREADDEFVLICCDGVWDVMTSQEAVTFVHEQLIKGAAQTLGRALELLLDKAIEKGSKDNVSAAIIAMPSWARVHNYFKPQNLSCACSLS